MSAVNLQVEREYCTTTTSSVKMVLGAPLRRHTLFQKAVTVLTARTVLREAYYVYIMI